MYGVPEIWGVLTYLLSIGFQHFALVLFLTLAVLMFIHLGHSKDEEFSTALDNTNTAELLEIGNKIEKNLRFLRKYKEELSRICDEVEELSSSYDKVESMIMKCQKGVVQVVEKLDSLEHQFDDVHGGGGGDAGNVMAN